MSESVFLVILPLTINSLLVIADLSSIARLAQTNQQIDMIEYISVM